MGRMGRMGTLLIATNPAALRPPSDGPFCALLTPALTLDSART
jgi:hypothetical protein